MHLDVFTFKYIGLRLSSFSMCWTICPKRLYWKMKPISLTWSEIHLSVWSRSFCAPSPAPATPGFNDKSFHHSSMKLTGLLFWHGSTWEFFLWFWGLWFFFFFHFWQGIFGFYNEHHLTRWIEKEISQYRNKPWGHSVPYNLSPLPATSPRHLRKTCRSHGIRGHRTVSKGPFCSAPTNGNIWNKHSSGDFLFVFLL